MIRLLVTASTFALLTACSSPQPFKFGATTDEGETEELDPTDPNTSVNSKFAFDRASGLTMNRVSYDAANDELVINNLPFDGPAGRYDFVQALGGGGMYESRQTATTGQIKHYAVFLRSDHIDATAAAGADWAGFGYGGANINRDSFSLPNDGEYVYVGDYLGVRTFSDRGGLELVSGDVRIILDVNDFDPVDGIQGAITGSVRNRTLTNPDGSAGRDQTSMSLAVIEFTTQDGTFDDGVASTNLEDGTAGAVGTFQGFLAGNNSTDIGANVVIEGPAYNQNVRFTIATFTFVNPLTGQTQIGTASGLTTNNSPVIQDYVNAGVEVPTLDYNSIDIPAGATITGTRTETQLFISDFEAREIGVLVAER